MKNLLLCSFTCAVLLGCDRDDVKKTECPVEFSHSASTIVNPSPPRYPCDYITAQKNGVSWTIHSTSSFAVENKNDTLYIFGMGNEESLVFKLLFDGPGTYVLPAIASNRFFTDHAYYYTTIGGDVIASRYVLAQHAAIEVTEYNEEENAIKGNFEFLLIESDGLSSMDFRNGSFSVHLPD